MLIDSISPFANMVVAYTGLFGGTGLFLGGLSRSKTGQQVGYTGMCLLLFMCGWLNYQYGLRSTAGEAIAFFNALYDPFYNIGTPSGNVHEHPGLIPCLDTADGPHNDCAADLSGAGYTLHASWASNFYARFTERADWTFNVARLYAHVWMNTTAFILGLVQFHTSSRKGLMWIHKKTGWAATLLATGGTLTAMWLGSGHGKEKLYGGTWAVLGWMEMGICVLGCLWQGIAAIKRKDIASHKKWMSRWWGTMWGAFLVFRVIFFAGGLLRFSETAMILIAIWSAAPLGILFSEYVRLRKMPKEATE